MTHPVDTLATPEQTRAFLATQLKEAKTAWAVITCECRRCVPIRFMYRCLYCGIWLCQTCAEIHFGKTREQYNRERQS